MVLWDAESDEVIAYALEACLATSPCGECSQQPSSGNCILARLEDHRVHRFMGLAPTVTLPSRWWDAISQNPVGLRCQQRGVQNALASAGAEYCAAARTLPSKEASLYFHCSDVAAGKQ